MGKAEIEKVINEFLIEEFEIDEGIVSGEAHLKDDLGLESLDFVDIVVTIESEFNFKVKREDMTDIRTLDDLYVYIDEHVN
ncbi:MAG: phosphopantetheine-binding protein [Bacteroidota bacterium]